jgi:hypothetical protein
MSDRNKTLAAVPAVAVLIAVVAIAAASIVDGGEDVAAQACREESSGQARDIGVAPIEYETLDEASRAFRFALPDVMSPGWSFTGAYGTEPNTNLPQGSFSFYAAFLVYRCNSTGDDFELTITPAGGSEMPGLEPITLSNGRMVGLTRDDGRVGVQWEQDGRTYTAMAATDESFSEDEFLEVLGSLE